MGNFINYANPQIVWGDDYTPESTTPTVEDLQKEIIDISTSLYEERLKYRTLQNKFAMSVLAIPWALVIGRRIGLNSVKKHI